MSRNTFGNMFCITSFGESHAKAMGVIIDGCPSGVDFDFDFLLECLEKRRPGNFGKKSDEIVSQRKEPDIPQVLSGVFEGKTLGTPIAIIVNNKDQRSVDYKDVLLNPRQGHADDVWKSKFGHTDHRGGGRSSGRETISRVMGGAVAMMLIRSITPKFKLNVFSSKIGPYFIKNPSRKNFENSDKFIARFPDPSQEELVYELLKRAKVDGKSYGGSAKVILENVPMGLGQPVFNKLKADLGFALLGIGASCAIDIGAGRELSEEEGSILHRSDQPGYGGIRGGISTGETIEMSLSFKPTSSVLDTSKQGRHDPCIVPRAIAVIEAMVSLVIADHLLWARLDNL